MTDEELADALKHAVLDASTLLREAAARLGARSAAAATTGAAGRRPGTPLPVPRAYPPGSWLTIEEAAAHAHTTVDALRIRSRKGQVKLHSRGHKGALSLQASPIDAHVTALAPAPGDDKPVPSLNHSVVAKDLSARPRNRSVAQGTAVAERHPGGARQLLADFKAQKATAKAVVLAKPTAPKTARRVAHEAARGWLRARRESGRQP